MAFLVVKRLVAVPSVAFFFLVLSDCESIDAFRAFGSPGLTGGGGSLFVWSAANSVATIP